MLEGIWKRGLVALMSVALVSAGACSSPEKTSASDEVTTTAGPTRATVTYSQNGCAYEGPTAVPPGPVTIEVVNAIPSDATPVVVYAALLSIDEGHTYDDLADWVRGPNAGAPPTWATTVVDGETSPGEEDELNAAVTAGTYGLVCATPHEKDPGILTPGSFVVTG